MWGKCLGILEHVGSWDRGGAAHQARTDVQLPSLPNREKLSDKRLRKTVTDKRQTRNKVIRNIGTRTGIHACTHTYIHTHTKM